MDFDERRRLKWKMGREERGLAADDPFDGDPACELEEEFIDAGNYLDELMAAGRITREERNQHYAVALSEWRWVREVMGR